MTKWQDQVKPLTLKGGITMPYTWSVGEVGSRFLTTLRDEKVITAGQCPKCKTIFVPPRKTCAKCFCETSHQNPIRLSGKGTVASFTIVHYDTPVMPAKAPFALAVINLDGADVGFVHLIKEKLDAVKIGSRVSPVFKKDAKGHILDIDCFALSEKE